MADDSEEALRLQRQIEELPSVSHVQSAAQFMEDDGVSEKLERIGRIKEIAEPLQILPPELNRVDIARLDQQLVRLQGYVSFAIGEVKDNPDEKELLETLKKLADGIYDLRLSFLRYDNYEVSRKLGYNQFVRISRDLPPLRDQDNSGPPRPENLPKPPEPS